MAAKKDPPTTAIAKVEAAPAAIERRSTPAAGGIRIETFDDLQRFCRAACASGYFEGASDVAQAIVKVSYGLEIGVTPIVAMTGIHAIKGKLAVSAGLISSRIKASGKYDYKIRKLTDERCELVFFERGEQVGDSEFTLANAKTAGLESNGMWKKYPRNMLFARALTNGARWYCAEVFAGPVYSPDEISNGDDGPDVVTMQTLDPRELTESIDAEVEAPRALPEPAPVGPTIVDAPAGDGADSEPPPVVTAKFWLTLSRAQVVSDVTDIRDDWAEYTDPLPAAYVPVIATLIAARTAELSGTALTAHQQSVIDRVSKIEVRA